ncbi:MAG: hypothetical protein LBE53_03700 [Paucimonas sp.]|jgi:type IV pilus assembly protein PilX|uniref:hypothetical protein n=1 Tax=Pantoea sp. Cy-639 TaxID=2608360 RepID=UPI0014246F8D|nr:hypothetical protein [Pantoea sp. Cy-639]MDR2306289.1 hypothetical protein [Paucimonas sp.]NIF19959.1 hypothetical protein [Pantoea sp. Cy-639]
MNRQRGVVLLLALVLSLLLALLATLALRDAGLMQRQVGEQLALVRGFEQAEAAVIEGLELLAAGLPPECRVCLPPDLPAALPGQPWQRVASGFVLLQNLGQTTQAKGGREEDVETLLRVTAVSEQIRTRQVVEAVYALEGGSMSRRVSWRQRGEDD